MSRVKKEPKERIIVYLKTSKIKKIRKYAINKGLKGQSAVIDMATDHFFKA